MQFLKSVAKAYNSLSLIVRILCGLIIGVVLALTVPQAQWISIFGNVFVGALKGIAPILVFVLITSALTQGSGKLDKRFGLVIVLYLTTTTLASITAVFVSFLFPTTLVLTGSAEAEAIPSGLGEVLGNLFTNAVANPVASLVNANYIGILFWAVLTGIALNKVAQEETKKVLLNAAEAVSQCVRWIINLAPFGIMGLVFTNVSNSGLSIFTDYGRLVLVLVGCMLFVAFGINAIVVFAVLKRNPYPLIWRCVKTSGLTAFFTRSSAANIPVNMNTCERLGLDKDIYSVSIPLGATINMDGAAITIAVMTLAAANTMGVSVDLGSALILSLLATLAACGASGVAGGSLLLIPMACSLFGISNDIAMQVVAVGFIIGVIQDSVETALNSAGDVVFAATAEYAQWVKDGEELPTFLGGKRKVDI
ncbi:MAG: serine/threonine transporter SstT [Lachnospiraceae bacterium]|nr:serine/threonine transporter SstT [Lachnospiraceae bacterium]